MQGNYKLLYFFPHTVKHQISCLIGANICWLNKLRYYSDHYVTINYTNYCKIKAITRNPLKLVSLCKIVAEESYLRLFV